MWEANKNTHPITISFLLFTLFVPPTSGCSDEGIIIDGNGEYLQGEEEGITGIFNIGYFLIPDGYPQEVFSLQAQFLTYLEEGEVSTVPQEMDTCAFTTFEEWPAGHETITYDAGEYIRFYSEGMDMTVSRQVLPEGEILYAWSEDASVYPFPFGETVSIEISGSESEESIPSFDLEEIITLSKGITVTSPPELTEGEAILQDVSEPLEIRWSYHDEEVDSEEISRTFLIEIRSTSNSNTFFETLFCNVENDGNFTIPESDLSLFNLEPEDPETGEILTLTQNLQIDLQLHRGDLPMPVEGSADIFSTISVSGPLILVDTE